MKRIKATLVLAASMAVFVSSCKKETPQQTEETATSTTTSEFAQVRMCTELTPDGVTPRGATLKAKQWVPGTVIKVSLNGGTSFVRNKVIQFASEWEQYANIDFKFVTNDNTAPIRVTFTQNGSSYSYIGTDAKLISRSKNTMNFGWFDSRTSDEEFGRTTIHEFGHALGMIHEQQHPLVSIPWDKPKVYSYYAQTQGWDQATVDQNLFASYSTAQTNYSAYDKTSIMHYPVDNSLTIGDYEVGWNTVLSDTDKAFIASVYP